MQNLIIINGPPASGKSYLGDLIARELRITYLNKDQIKEVMFEHLGADALAQTKKLGATGFELLFHLLETQLKNGLSCLVETAFYPTFHSRRFSQLIDRYLLNAIQIYCFSDFDVLQKRFFERVKIGERHPGHMDHLLSEEEFEQMLVTNKYGRLDVAGAMIEIDTSDFARLDYPGVIQKLRSYL